MLFPADATILAPPAVDTWNPNEEVGLWNDNVASRATLVGDTLILIILCL